MFVPKTNLPHFKSNCKGAPSRNTVTIPMYWQITMDSSLSFFSSLIFPVHEFMTRIIILECLKHQKEPLRMCEAFSNFPRS
jgi:hypothetical protein